MHKIAKSLLDSVAPIDSIKLKDPNPRQGNIPLLKQSFEMFGQRKPIVVNENTMVCEDGNHSLQAMRELGWTEVAVSWVDDDEATALAYSLTVNKSADNSTYDDEILLEELNRVKDFDPELFNVSGWTADDLKSLASNPPVRPPDPDQIPEQPIPVTQLGDVWLLGEHRVICGDSRAVNVLPELMQGDVADMVWTDPPYGVSYVGKTEEELTIENDKLDADQLSSFLISAFQMTLDSCKQGGVWFVASPGGPLLNVFGSTLIQLGIFRQTITWVKNSLVMGHSDYHYRHETLYYGWKPGAAHQTPTERTWDTIWEFDRPTSSREHPTMKPVALIERAILNHTDPGQIVLDPFGGSGSTLIAAHLNNRKARLVELSPHYVDVICARYETTFNDKPILQSTGQPHTFQTPT